MGPSKRSGAGIHAIAKLDRTLAVFPVTAVLGPRQCGKTALARMIAARQPCEFFDLEDPADARRLSAPMTVLEKLWVVYPGSKPYDLDEVTSVVPLGAVTGDRARIRLAAGNTRRRFELAWCFHPTRHGRSNQLAPKQALRVSDLHSPPARASSPDSEPRPHMTNCPGTDDRPFLSGRFTPQRISVWPSRRWWHPLLVMTALATIITGACAPASGERPYKVGRAGRDYVDLQRQSWIADAPRPLATTIWYPAQPTAEETAWMVGGPALLPVFRAGRAAAGAELLKTVPYPLVLLSHGTGGSSLSDLLQTAGSDPALRDSVARHAASYRDPRVRGVFTMAPAMVRALRLDTLEVPVHLVVGDADDQAGPSNNGELVAAAASRARLIVLPGVSHYTFLVECTLTGRLLLRSLCVDPAGIDRREIHSQVQRQALTFFEELFSDGPMGSRAGAPRLNVAGESRPREHEAEDT